MTISNCFVFLAGVNGGSKTSIGDELTACFRRRERYWFEMIAIRVTTTKEKIIGVIVLKRYCEREQESSEALGKEKQERRQDFPSLQHACCIAAGAWQSTWARPWLFSHTPKQYGGGVSPTQSVQYREARSLSRLGSLTRACLLNHYTTHNPATPTYIPAFFDMNKRRQRMGPATTS